MNLPFDKQLMFFSEDIGVVETCALSWSFSFIVDVQKQSEEARHNV